MKKHVLLLCLSLCCLAPARAEEWKQEKGDHFIVFYANEAARPKEVIRKAEFYYNKIAEDLGYPRYSNFWQWDKRAKIYIHPSPEAFRKATGQPEWSHGMASYLDKSIHAEQASDEFLDAVLPHEIAHLIFRDFVGLRNHIPLWMDEGVAQWEEDAKRRQALEMMPTLIGSGQVYPIDRLTAVDIRKETDGEKVALFYAQAISLVDFLIRSYGPSSFTVFCREMRDGKRLQEALRAAYPDKLPSIDAMEQRWRSFVKGNGSGSKETAAPAEVWTS